MALKEELIKTATELEIHLVGDETNAQLQDLIEGKNNEDAEALAKAGEEAKDKVKKAKEDAKKAGTEGDKQFTKEDVKTMIQAALKQFAESRGEEVTAPDEHLEERPTLRLARFQNKFIMALKDLNTDEFNKDEKILSTDVWNDRTRVYEPWVTVVFDDKTELFIQLESVLKRSVKNNNTVCEILEVIEEADDVVYGKVEKMEMDTSAFSEKGTGVMITAKQSKKKYNYKIKMPNGDVAIVAPEVINW